MERLDDKSLIAVFTSIASFDPTSAVNYFAELPLIPSEVISRFGVFLLSV